ncbi:MAG: ATP-binding protein [Coprococcus sp.]
MNIKQAKDEIRHTVQAYLTKDALGDYAIPVIRQRPILLIGPPGIGKTAIMSQVARECQVALVSYTITHHTRQSAIGLPYIEKKIFGGKEYAITEYTMSEIVASIYEKMEATGLKEGILFIDEINCVSETLAPTMLQFLQGKTFGNHKIPEGWVIVTAGNPPEYNQSVRDFDIVTLDRVKRITVEEDYPVWKAYAYENHIHSAILSYLDIKKENFYQVETTVDGKEIVTARGWEDLSKLMQVYDQLGITVDESVVLQYIQNRRIAKDFANYLDLYKKYQTDYDVEAVVQGKVKPSAIDRIQKASFDEKLSVISILISRLTAVFSEVYDKDLYVRDLYEILKELKFTFSHAPADGSGTARLLSEKAEQVEADLELNKERGLYDAPKLRSIKNILKTLDQYRLQLIKDEKLNPEEAFCYIKTAFAEDTAERKNLIETAAAYLENAFLFMESAFGESQEMVIFITELNTNRYCARFIRDNGSVKYDRYNRSLLFDEKRQNLLRDIDEISDFAAFLD